MRNYLHDEEQLGHQVDALLLSLRTQGLSERRIGELAGLLGNAMNGNGPRTREEASVLQRFEAWQQQHQTPTPRV